MKIFISANSFTLQNPEEIWVMDVLELHLCFKESEGLRNK